MSETIRRAQIIWPDGIAFLDFEWTPSGPDPEGGWLVEGKLESVHVVNTSLTRRVRVCIKRGSGQGPNFIIAILQPGTNQIYTPPFGPVKNIEDVPWFSFGEVP